MVRRQRFFASLLAAFALVFAQLAVAAHWCSPAHGHAQAAPVEVMAHHAACHEMAPASGDMNGNLCQAHCQYGAASTDNTSAVPPAIDAVGPVVFLLVPAAGHDTAKRRAGRIAPSAAPPPPAILFGVLRI